MKKIKLFCLLAATVLAAVGCKEDIPEDILTLTSTEIAVASEGTTQPISFKASTAWTIESSETWITFDKASGDAGEATVQMTVAANETYDARTATVTIAMGDKKTEIKVNQKMVVSFSSETLYTIDAKAQTIEFEIESNLESTFTISDDAKSWISAVTTKSAPVASVKTFTIKANDTLKPRTGKIAVKAGDSAYGLVIVQNAEFENLPDAKATAIGRTMKIYDGSYYDINEFAIELSGEDTKVVLAVNAALDAPITEVPVGTFAVDAAADHSAGTFSIKPLDGSEPVYTTVMIGENETLIEDGEITITKEGNVYTIAAVLVDNHENLCRYSFIGEIATVEDKTFGAYISEVTFKGQYNTYFTTKANEWYFVIPVSKAPAADALNINYISFNVFGATGDVDGSIIPTGTFTFNEPTSSETVTFANGVQMSNTNDLTSLYAYDNGGSDDSKTWNAIKDSTIAIAKNDDGTYNFTFNLKLENTEYIYDDAWNLLDTKVTNGSYAATIENVRMNGEVDTTSLTKPVPDGNIEITGALAQYSGLYIGNKAVFDALDPATFTIPEGTSLLVVGNTNLNNMHTLYMPLVVKGYEFVQNYSRYCNTPPAAGTYTFSKTPAENAVLSILYGSSSYCYIRNGYTGTTMTLNGGSVTIDAKNITFNLKMTDGTNTYDLTGTMPFTYQFAQNWTSRAKNFKLVP